jgi:hypothetical protein
MSNGKTFLDISPEKGRRTTVIVIVVFMLLGAGLYWYGNKGVADYAVKIGDCFIQGAIISILFAFLKAMIDKSPWWRVFLPSTSTHQRRHAMMLRDCVRQRVPDRVD